MREFNIYAGMDKGEAVLVVAPDLSNAKTMVDASTVLKKVGTLIVTDEYKLKVQGLLDIETIVQMSQSSSS